MGSRTEFETMRVGGFVVDCGGKVMDFSVDTVVKKINIFG